MRYIKPGGVGPALTCPLVLAAPAPPLFPVELKFLSGSFILLFILHHFIIEREREREKEKERGFILPLSFS